jgi:hypothetical protein
MLLRRQLNTSRLLAVQWDVPSVGVVAFDQATAALLAKADRQWPPMRRVADANLHWLWSTIAARAHERFALVTPDGDLLALWCSSRSKPLSLPGGLFYRLDYIEIDPSRRGTALGPFTFAVCATRALELGCDGLVLGALPQVGSFYQRLGGVQRREFGWQEGQNLLPYAFDREALEELQDRACDVEV